MKLDEAEFSAWFRLIEAPGVGRASVRRLLSHCGSPDAVLDASPTLLRSLLGPAPAEGVLHRHPTVEQRLQQALLWLRGADGRHVIPLGSAWYPPLLLHAPDPPLLLYLQGQPHALAGRGVAIVGSRNATAQGLDNARAFGKELSRRGLVVFSGLAAGIDAAAHEGALAAAEAGGSPTVAVVGTGLDVVYPRTHAELARRISQAGALVSEFSPGTPPLAQNFPQRNRILAGLSLGTLVVEAAVQSGSLITARLAAEAGREVFAVPGSIHAAQSKGSHALLKQGAKLVETAQDIIEELEGALQGARVEVSAAAPSKHEVGLDTELQSLLHALGSDPLSLEMLVSRTGWPAALLSARLMQLELAGHVARLPGSLYQRRYLG
jgi:DNA processing protein